VHPSRCGVGLQLRSVRTKRYKATFELTSGAGELYDLADDPQETTNLFDDPGHAAVRKELEGLMRERPGPVLGKLAEPIGMA
jgi:arylsulfatase A-like enzyme